MQDQEQDSQRCSFLRQTEKDIDDQLEKPYEKDREARSELSRLRSRLSGVVDELTELEILRGAALIASSGRSLIANGIGLVGGDISSKISRLKNKKEQLGRNIGYAKSKIDQLRNRINYFTNARDKNSAELIDLNCAR